MFENLKIDYPNLGSEITLINSYFWFHSLDSVLKFLIAQHAMSRLCQDVVLLKPEVAELLLPSVVVDLAGRKDIGVNIQSLISDQVAC